MGKVRMCVSEFHLGDQTIAAAQGRTEVGGFVLCQKCPEVWYLELIMAGQKMNACCTARPPAARRHRHSSTSSVT